jgi:hypothetical protein
MTKPNRRAQRLESDSGAGPASTPRKQPGNASTPQDTSDPRAKSTGHRKKTADKWNQ